MEEWIARFTGAKWLFVVLGLLLASTALGKPPSWLWAVSGAVALGGLGVLSIWQYERKPESVKAMFFMVHGTAASLALLLPSSIEEAARKWASNYWLYRDYLYVYCAIYLAIVLYSAMSKKWQRKEAKEQMEMLRAAALEGRITARDLFEIVSHNKGAKKAFRNWGPSKLAPIMGLTATAMAVAGFWHGRDGMLYFCFLLSILVSPFLVGAMLRQQLELQRYLGRQDIAIIF